MTSRFLSLLPTIHLFRLSLVSQSGRTGHWIATKMPPRPPGGTVSITLAFLLLPILQTSAYIFPTQVKSDQYRSVPWQTFCQYDQFLIEFRQQLEQFRAHHTDHANMTQIPGGIL